MRVTDQGIEWKGKEERVICKINHSEARPRNSLCQQQAWLIPMEVSREASCLEAKASGTSGVLLSSRSALNQDNTHEEHDCQIPRKNKRVAHAGGLGLGFYFIWGVGLVWGYFYCDAKAWTSWKCLLSGGKLIPEVLGQFKEKNPTKSHQELFLGNKNQPNTN